MKIKLCIILFLLSAAISFATPKRYLMIGIPEAAYTAGVQNKLDKFIQRFSDWTNTTTVVTNEIGLVTTNYGDTCGMVQWVQTSNTTKVWYVTALATEHLQVHQLDKLDDDKLQALKDQIADLRIRVEWSDNPVQDLRDSGLQPRGGLEP